MTLHLGPLTRIKLFYVYFPVLKSVAVILLLGEGRGGESVTYVLLLISDHYGLQAIGDYEFTYILFE